MDDKIGLKLQRMKDHKFGGGEVHVGEVSTIAKLVAADFKVPEWEPQIEAVLLGKTVM